MLYSLRVQSIALFFFVAAAAVSLLPANARAGACPACDSAADCEMFFPGETVFCVEHASDVGCGPLRRICCPGQGCAIGVDGRPTCEAAGTCTVIGDVTPDAGTPPADAGTTTDGGAPDTDAGIPTADSGSPTGDGGTPTGDGGGTTRTDAGTTGRRDDSGCGCRVAASGAGGGPALLGIGAVLALALARRRRTRSV